MEKIITNFAGSTAKSDLAKLSNAVTSNMFVETKSSDYAMQTVLRGMNGWSKLFDSTGRPRAVLKASNGRYFWVAGNKFYCNGIVLTSVSDTLYCKMAETGGMHPRIIVVDGFNMYAVDSTLDLSVMPNNVKRIELPNSIEPIDVCVVYDFILVLAKGTDKVYSSVQYPWETDYSQYGSTEDDIFMLHFKSLVDNETLLYPIGYWITADYRADTSNSITSSNGMLYVGGPKSIQAFSYKGGTPLSSTSVWSRQDSSCAGLNVYEGSMIDLDGKMCFVGCDGVYVGSNKVSNDDIDRRIAGEGFYRVGFLKWFSHVLFVIYTNKSCIVYDTGYGTWLDLSTNRDGVEMRFRYLATSEKYGLDSSALVEWTDSKWDEHDGNKIVKSRRSPIMCRDGSRVRIDKLQLCSNSGQFDGTGSFEWYVDGVCTKAMTFPISVVGNYSHDKNYDFIKLGIGEQFEVKFATDANAPIGFYAVKVDVKEVMR